MAAPSTGNRLQAAQQAEVDVAILDHPDTKKAFSTFRLLLENSYGPSGQMALLHNNSGGHVTMTSSSGRLLPLLSISKPMIKLIYTTLIGHINAYKDSGLFTGLFMLHLIQESMCLEIHRRLVINLLGTLLEECVQFLSTESCRYKIRYNTLNVDTMTRVVNSCLSPKQGCGLTNSEIEHITSTVVKVFLKSVSTNGSQSHYNCDIAYMCIEGKSPKESNIIDGIMFQAPQYPVYMKNQLSLKTTQTVNHKGHIKVALVNISMSGDTDIHTDATFEVSDGVSISDAMVEIISDFARHLLEAGVGVVLSQRVVHPKVKSLLGDGDVMVIDRLGKVVAGQVERLSGAVPIKSFSLMNTDRCYGYLQSIEHKVYNKKSYLHLQGLAETVLQTRYCTPVCTLVLCNRSEETLAELKYNCESAVHSLKLLAHTPSVLVGGGCWQTGLVHHLSKMLNDKNTELATKHQCTKYQIRQVSGLVHKAMYKTLRILWRDCDLLTDIKQRHLWPLPVNTDVNTVNSPSCACGGVKFGAKTTLVDFYENGNLLNIDNDTDDGSLVNDIEFKDVEILDVGRTAVSALRVAIGTASMVIGIHNYISDTN